MVVIKRIGQSHIWTVAPDGQPLEGHGTIFAYLNQFEHSQSRKINLENNIKRFLSIKEVMIRSHNI